MKGMPVSPGGKAAGERLRRREFCLRIMSKNRHWLHAPTRRTRRRLDTAGLHLYNDLPVVARAGPLPLNIDTSADKYALIQSQPPNLPLAHTESGPKG
jgi:hypothetical protein